MDGESKDLLRERGPVWPRLSDEERKTSLELADDYRAFLDRARTERQAVAVLREMADNAGLTPLNGAIPAGGVYWTHRDKMIAMFKPGRRPISEGLHLVVAHLDAPRLDLKLNPLIEAEGLAWLKTHYYGGIKKFHWVAAPLALHGVVHRRDGTVVPISVGDDPNDPVLATTDLLPHLAARVQGDKRLREAIHPEKLNALTGSLPAADDDAKDPFKLAVLQLLFERYGIEEEDLISAELELVPAGKSRDVGLDRGCIGGYGHDDRACSWAAARALLDLQDPVAPALVVLLDKEEIGSDGNTGAKSRIIELLFADLLRAAGETLEADTLLRCFARTRVISADVTAAIDPSWTQVHDKHNDARLGHGINLTKYTGARGKAGANDAHAEFVAWIRRAWNDAGVIWQAGELGRVDEGGGGTVAKFFAALGMDVVDAGPPLLSMHAPFEILHKADLFMTIRAYGAMLAADPPGDHP